MSGHSSGLVDPGQARPAANSASREAHLGQGAALRSDNGPEFIAYAVRDWLADLSIRSNYITPGSPWEHAQASWQPARFYHIPLVPKLTLMVEYALDRAVR